MSLFATKLIVLLALLVCMGATVEAQESMKNDGYMFPSERDKLFVKRLWWQGSRATHYQTPTQPNVKGPWRIARSQQFKGSEGIMMFEAGMIPVCAGSIYCPQITTFVERVKETALTVLDQATRKRVSLDPLSVNFVTLPKDWYYAGTDSLYGNGDRASRAGKPIPGQGMLGDIVAVIYKGRIEFGVYADHAPKGYLGRISVKMMEMLNVNPYSASSCMEGMKNPPPAGCMLALESPTYSPPVTKGAVYIVFPNTRNKAKWDSYSSVRRMGFALLKLYGGYKGSTATTGGFQSATGAARCEVSSTETGSCIEERRCKHQGRLSVGRKDCADANHICCHHS